MIRTLMTLAALIAPTLSAAPVPKANKPATLDGDWKWESQERNGQVSPPPQGDFLLWRVEGDTMTLIDESGKLKEEPCEFVGEQSPDGPRKFEYKVKSNGHHCRGVCEVAGDTLRVAFGSDNAKPPGEVKSSGSVSVFTLKRVTK